MKIFLLFLVFITILFNSCTHETKHDNYIDIKIQTSREYTPEERAKIREASKRFYEHVKIVDNQCILSVKSGDEIGIPNEFYYLFKMGIDDANETAKNTGYEIADPNQ